MKLSYLCGLSLLLLCISTNAQTYMPVYSADSSGEWLVYNMNNSPLTSDYINTFYFEPDGTTYIGYGIVWAYFGDGGLIKLRNGNWEVFTHNQLGWGNHLIQAVTIRGTGDDIYLGLGDANWGGGGVIKNQGLDWTTIIWGHGDENSVGFLTTDNSGNIWVGYEIFSRYGQEYCYGLSIIQENEIIDIGHLAGIESNYYSSCDSYENEVWISVAKKGYYPSIYSGGLAKFSDNEWTMYNNLNSEIGTISVLDIKIDDYGNIWLGTIDGIRKFDRENWTSIYTYSSTIPNNIVSNLAIDKNNNIWFSNKPWEGIGLVKYDGANFEVYDTLNSPLPSNSINKIEIDDNNNIWIATYKGFAIFNEVQINFQTEINQYLLFNNYPNPFNPYTTIEYQIPELSFVTINVYDVLGNEITTLVNEDKTAGEYEIKFDGTELTSGIYFYRIQAGSFVETKKMVLLK